MDKFFPTDQNDRDALFQRLEAIEAVIARHEALFAKEGHSINDSPETTDGAIHFSGQFENASGSISYSWSRPHIISSKKPGIRHSPDSQHWPTLNGV